MTLLLGPPGSGKSTLLKALSGRLHMSGLKYHGEVRHTAFPCHQPAALRLPRRAAISTVRGNRRQKKGKKLPWHVLKL